MDLKEKDKQYIWHPFTQMQDWFGAEPLIIERGEGAYLFDTDGNRYLDGVSSLWVTLHGHRRKEIDDAVHDQLGKIAHSTMLGLTNVPSIELAEKLVKITPKGLEKVFYSDSGSTAVEIALKIAFQYWQHVGGSAKEKTKFITLNNAYHGDTIGSISVGGIDLFHEIYRPLLFDSIKAPSPFCYRCELGLTPDTCSLACAEELKKLVRTHSAELAALIVEPAVQAAAGMIVAPEGYLTAAREVTEECDVLLIADEVATGFGRTGKMFACELEAVSPDMMTVAKGISGGYLPIAATLATNRIFDKFLGQYTENKTLFHGHTYTGNPLAAAAACASMDIFEKDKTLDNLAPKIELLEEVLRGLKSHKNVGDVRQMGVMVGVELVHDKESKEPFEYGAKIGHKVCFAARSKGMIVRPLGDVLILMPPLSATMGQLKEMMDIMGKCIEEVMGN